MMNDTIIYHMVQVRNLGVILHTFIFPQPFIFPPSKCNQLPKSLQFKHLNTSVVIFHFHLFQPSLILLFFSYTAEISNLPSLSRPELSLLKTTLPQRGLCLKFPIALHCL